MRENNDPNSRVPIDVVESTIWFIVEQTLRTSVRPWENLLEIGATSIDALRIIGRVAEETGVKVALERFLLRPTVQDLARLAREKRGAGDGGSRSWDGDLSRQVPLLLPFGRVSVILSLLPPTAQAVVCTVEPPDVREDSPLVSVSDLLAQYPAPVRRWLSESPVVAAYSVAADLAIEAVARRERQGRPVRRLILVDPALQPHVRSARMSQLLELSSEDLRNNPDLLKVLDDIDEFRRTSVDRRRADQLPELLSALKPHVELFARLDDNFELHDSERALLFRDYASFFRLMVAASQHEPPTIDAPVTVVVSSQYERQGGGRVLEQCRSFFHGPVELLRVPGDHFTALLSPELAELFANALGQSPGLVESPVEPLRPSWLRP
jgi:thioesterase domain-containing protein/acyl carrier protein